MVTILPLDRGSYASIGGCAITGTTVLLPTPDSLSLYFCSWSPLTSGGNSSPCIVLSRYELFGPHTEMIRGPCNFGCNLLLLIPDFHRTNCPSLNLLALVTCGRWAYVHISVVCL